MKETETEVTLQEKQISLQSFSLGPAYNLAASELSPSGVNYVADRER